MYSTQANASAMSALMSEDPVADKLTAQFADIVNN